MRRYVARPGGGERGEGDGRGWDKYIIYIYLYKVSPSSSPLPLLALPFADAVWSGLQYAGDWVGNSGPAQLWSQGHVQPICVCVSVRVRVRVCICAHAT